ncbi:MAG: peptide chain release factor 1 [Candidatus Omnitrophota bacterium]|nr:peptide chain release factor 1 [Candidatus Omnitrophota bacterium]MBU1524400.1 peptide chain release factor 1 [Candidatus Omnitrophota bacterium]MBU2436713.1 peptide chain release factor 1 [Candidatus Omnitrophota bacterium]
MINLDKLKEEYKNLTQEFTCPEILNNREKYTNLTKRFSFLEKVINLLKIRDDYFKERKNLQNVLFDYSEGEDVKNLAQEELNKLEEKIKTIEEDIEDRVFGGCQPQRDIIIEMRAATGGEEAALFVSDLFKLYSKYIERKGWKIEILSSHPTEIGGFKEIIFSVKGKEAYAHLKFESGVHRVQRVPATESGGRIHTSTVTVAVLIEPKEIDLEINPEDLRIDTYRSSGAGGQHVNVTDSAVRITHLPSGVVVACQDERSQIKNRAKAMRVLKARIMEKSRREETKKITSQRRIQIGTGERSEKIRTYNFPERRVTDHRINLTLYRLEQVLDGYPDEIIKKLISEERKKNYEIKELDQFK